MSAGTGRAREALYDIDPRTGSSIEVFYADRTLETFGTQGAGWFWWRRRRGFSPDGTLIADWLVRHGLALDWPQYSKGGYADAQAEAKREQRGMWSGSFKEPWNYRACGRSGGRPENFGRLRIQHIVIFPFFNANPPMPLGASLL